MLVKFFDVKMSKYETYATNEHVCSRELSLVLNKNGIVFYFRKILGLINVNVFHERSKGEIVQRQVILLYNNIQ